MRLPVRCTVICFRRSTACHTSLEACGTSVFAPLGMGCCSPVSPRQNRKRP